MGRVLDHIETWIVGILGLAMLAVAIAQVLARYVLPWLVAGGGEEIVVYLFVWAAMIACAGRRRAPRISGPTCCCALSPRQLRIVELINAIAAAGFCALLVWYGWEVVDIALLIDERSQTGISFPMWIYYLALPAGRCSC